MFLLLSPVEIFFWIACYVLKSVHKFYVWCTLSFISGTQNSFTRFLLCCLKCCFWCLEKFLKFINRNAYIMVCAVSACGLTYLGHWNTLATTSWSTASSARICWISNGIYGSFQEMHVVLPWKSKIFFFLLLNSASFHACPRPSP